jgi:PIN domain nuclease of toxin-antitoxin system
MKILLDTHVFLWWCGAPSKLPDHVLEAIGDTSHDIFVSAASLWEISTKIRIGKLIFPRPLGRTLADEVEAEHFSTLPIHARHAELAGGLDHDHRDPFDRMLIAQSLCESMSIASNELIFDDFGVRRFW